MVVLAFAAVAFAQDHRPATVATETITFVKTGLFVVSGGGGNTAVRLSGNGVILVDGKLAGNYAPLMSRTHAIADELPVRLLITTGPDASHTGTNSEFLQAGIPILAQEHVKEILTTRADERSTTPPSITFDRERKIELGGVSVQVLHFGPAHTNGDAVVYFPDLKVVAVGDLYTSATAEVDFAAGGSLSGWRTTLEQILQLDFDTVIPGQGPVVKRADLQALAARMEVMASAR
jgi:glyoxylase-like metal-dependent hydrolase (beta-lactamase superfamily II)